MTLQSSPTVIYTASSTLTASFKLALKSPNGHVFLAALACLAPYFAGLGSPFDPDASVSSATGDPPSGQQRLHVLKHAISTLVSGSSGSILTGLGDAKEKTREAARTALVAAAHAASGLADLVPAGGVNEPLAELERIVKEVGFANKAARARAEVRRDRIELASALTAGPRSATTLPRSGSRTRRSSLYALTYPLWSRCSRTRTCRSEVPLRTR